MEGKEFDSSVLSAPLPDTPEGAEVELAKLMAPGSPYWSNEQRDYQLHNKVGERVEKLYGIKSQRAEEGLKGIPPEHRGFAHELNKTFKGKDDVIKSGEEAREGWQNSRINEMQDKTIAELRTKWGKDFESNMEKYVDPIVKEYLSSPADKEWLNSIGPDGQRIGDDVYLIEKIFELGQYISKRHYLKGGSK